jgi:hypothetical protein
MYQVRFIGKIVSESLKISVQNGPTISYDIHEINIHISCKININQSKVEVICDCEKYEDAWLGWFHNYAMDFASAQVDLIGFCLGKPLEVVFYEVIDANGKCLRLSNEVGYLRGLCKSFSLEASPNPRFEKLCNEVLYSDPNIFLALSELRMSLRFHTQTLHACQRAIERIRNSISSNDNNEKRAWKALRDSLQIDRSYLDYICNASKPHRHGQLEYVDSAKMTELRRRSWIIMDRFLEYRLRDSVALPQNEFPILA